MDPQKKIKTFYDETGMERDRLELSVFKLEKTRTQQIIERNLRPEMEIADIGGASGAYSFWLQKLGHKVHLLDFAETHIEMARQRGRHQSFPLSSITLGDARALPFA
ncbi:MAG: class I SAM-dependent methyltransferase, partial [Bacteroidetes bacterium]